MYTEQLEAGDRVLLYTDGVTDGRAADGTPFGVDRFSDFIIRNSNEGTPVPETLRRLNQAITDYQKGRLYDDATIVLIEWMPDRRLSSSSPDRAGGRWNTGVAAPIPGRGPGVPTGHAAPGIPGRSHDEQRFLWAGGFRFQPVR